MFLPFCWLVFFFLLLSPDINHYAKYFNDLGSIASVWEDKLTVWRSACRKDWRSGEKQGRGRKTAKVKVMVRDSNSTLPVSVTCVPAKRFICLVPDAPEDHLASMRCSSKWKKSEEWLTPGSFAHQLRSSITSFLHLPLVPLLLSPGASTPPLRQERALESCTHLFHCTVSFSLLDINYLCSRSPALLTQPGWG